jgi:hypothetical protein
MWKAIKSKHVVVFRDLSTTDIAAIIKESSGIHDYIDRLTGPNDTDGSYTGWYTKVIRYGVCTKDADINNPLAFDPMYDLSF